MPTDARRNNRIPRNHTQLLQLPLRMKDGFTTGLSTTASCRPTPAETRRGSPNRNEHRSRSEIPETHRPQKKKPEHCKVHHGKKGKPEKVATMSEKGKGSSTREKKGAGKKRLPKGNGQSRTDPRQRKSTRKEAQKQHHP